MARVVILVGLWSITLETFFFQLILWKILFDVFQGVTLHYITLHYIITLYYLKIYQIEPRKYLKVFSVTALLCLYQLTD